MHSGQIDVRSLDGGLDLRATLESGQSYLWNREDGRMYDGDGGAGDGDTTAAPWYWTVYREGEASGADRESPGVHSVRVDRGDPVVIRVRQRDSVLEWEATADAAGALVHLLRLDDDLPAIRRESPDDDLIETAFDRYPGMRLVRDPPFGALVSFICSAQMRVSRIHGMQVAMCELLGDPITVWGRTYHAYPRPDQIAAAGEDTLRELNLGYRAPYVERSAAMVRDGEAHPVDASEMDYLDARASLTRFVGVGEKVADCVLLFSLGFLEAVPLDTWIRRTISDYYPACDQGTYAETSAAIREQFGGAYAGYVQTYVFHHLRNGGGD